MVVVALLLVGSVFAIAVSEVIAEETTTLASPSPSASSTAPAEVTPTPTPSEAVSASPTATPTPTPSATPTVDPAVVLDDIIKHRQKARQLQKKARKARAELCKRRAAFSMSMPLKLKGRKDFATWKETKLYFRSRLADIREKNRELWKKMVKHSGEGTYRWIPLLRYCGMPESQMWHAIKVMRGESHGDPKAKNPTSTASGLFQFLASWWRGKWNPFDAHQNVLHFVRAIKQPYGWGHWAATA